ncbi:efflux RND transporter periplasmic adaptor subunit [Candidatus Uhrbacteria bacterium]|nr:efflux RND transporter periplasmic adaptor subunit [Candidatus Uhrbacteria bacterium]
MKFLKNKWFWIVGVGVIVVGGFWYSSRNANQGPFYETRKVERGGVIQTVEITGEIKPDARLNLAFKSTAPLERVFKKTGSIVKRGDIVAELEARDLRFAMERARASLALAQANLSARLAGETKESIAIAQAQVDQAKASYDKAVLDLDITKQSVQDEYRIAQLALENARQANENSGASADQTVITAYANLKSALQASLGAMRTGLIDGDEIVGIDNSSANDDYESLLGLYARESIERAKQEYPIAKATVAAAENAVSALGQTPANEAVLGASVSVKDALEKVQSYLDNVQKALAGTITNSSFTETELASKKATISADRTAVSSQLSAVIASAEAARSSGLTSKTSKDSLQIAYDTAKANFDIAERNLTNKVKTAETAVLVQRAALSQAEAQLSQKKAGPREVDVAGLRAQVLDASTAFQQAQERLADVQIIAPVDGIITEIVPNIGEQVTANVTAVKMVSTEGYTVEALVPEADIAKVEAGQSIEITLDAFGDDVKFKGVVVSENPDQTKVSEAIYYKVYATIEAEGRDIKPGMTANLIVKTGERENVLVVPTRALRERDGQRYVRVLENKQPKEVNVELGLRGDEGRTEVVSGVTEGQIVVISEVSADEFGKLEADAKAGN